MCASLLLFWLITGVFMLAASGPLASSIVVIAVSALGVVINGVAGERSRRTRSAWLRSPRRGMRGSVQMIALFFAIVGVNALCVTLTILIAL